MNTKHDKERRLPPVKDEEWRIALKARWRVAKNLTEIARKQEPRREAVR